MSLFVVLCACVPCVSFLLISSSLAWIVGWLLSLVCSIPLGGLVCFYAVFP